MPSTQEATETVEHRQLRRDAIRNQERVLAAAVTTMLRDGRQVPMSVIADEAGVGVGTLYRRYPNREALLLALTERSFAMLVDIAEEIVRMEGTGLDRLRWWWERTIDEYDHLVLPLGGAPSALTATGARHRNRLHVLLRRLINDGKNDGTLRPDLSLADVILFGAMLLAPVDSKANWRTVARRQAQLHLSGVAGVATREI